MAKRISRLKLTLIIVVILSVTTVALNFFKFRQMTDRQAAPLPEQTTKAIMSFAQVHQTATKNGALQWELNADSAQLEAGTGRMILMEPKVRFYLEDGTQVYLKATQGFLQTRSNDIQVEGNVQVRNDRYTLLTDVLAYKHEERILRAHRPIHIKGEAIDLRAATMTYYLNTNQALFSGQVKGLLNENLPI